MPKEPVSVEQKTEQLYKKYVKNYEHVIAKMHSLEKDPQYFLIDYCYHHTASKSYVDTMCWRQY